jgi:hypothetical protein
MVETFGHKAVISGRTLLATVDHYVFWQPLEGAKVGLP